MDTETGYSRNWVPSSILFSKSVGSIDWSLVSNEPNSSLHTNNVTLSRKHGIVGLAAALKLDAAHKSNELVHQTPETNPVLSLLPVKESQDYGSDVRMMRAKEKNTKFQLNPINKMEKKEVENDGDDMKEIIHDDSSICCRSDASNSSISSFTFPILHNEDENVKTPIMETIWNVFDKRLELSQPQTQPQPQIYITPATHTRITQLPPQRKSSSSKKQASETQSQKICRNRWFCCFYSPF